MKKQKTRPLTARIKLIETKCGFVKLKTSLPKSCYADVSFIRLFRRAVEIMQDDIMSMQTRKLITDDTQKQQCEILFKRSDDPNANITVGIQYETPTRIKKPTTYESCKYTAFYALQERLSKLIVN